MTLVLVLGAAYLLGSTPSSYLVVRWMTGRDIRDIGSGNPGTMNVLDHVGLLPAVLVGAGDIGKGVAAVLLAYLAGLGDGAAVFAALLVVAGHDWSIFLRLGGGNGTGPTVGVLLALLPVATLISTVVAFLVWAGGRLAPARWADGAARCDAVRVRAGLAPGLGGRRGRADRAGLRESVARRGVRAGGTAAMSALAELLERFRLTVAGKADEVPLARAALLIAAAESPGVDVERYELQLDEWGRKLEARIHPATEPERRLQAVNELLFAELGFRGNEEQYSDPRNLLLNEVIERRTGIPVSLAIVAVEVCQRAGLDVRAVGLPGHVVTRMERGHGDDGPPLFSDVFRAGAIRSVDDLRQIVRSIYGRRTPFREHFLDPLTPRQVLQRLLHNLKGGRCGAATRSRRSGPSSCC